MSLTTLLIGRPLANKEAEGRKIGVFEGLPAMGLDGLGSAAYGPEAMLTVLAVVGAAGLGVVQPITWVILILLAILFLSYWQTIAAYPSNGGAYTVARENLGTDAGLLAAAALMVDYMLNVAVGISAGIGALTSAVPALHTYTLWLCLGVLALVTLVNLRGTRESGVVFAGPTYVFVASLGFVLAAGAWRAWTGDGHPAPVVAPPAVPDGSGAVTLWLLLRAFAAGCTAMTGVEAVSNGVSAFKEPRTRHAHRTLTAIVVILGLLLLGIAYVARGYGVMAMDETKEGYQSVLSQLVTAVWGRGWLYYVTIGAVLAVLCLSANTSFVGFPRLCRQVAHDGFLPKAFAVPGRRLVYTAGILFLTGGAGLLLAAFGGITDRLIPLFAVGAFLSFTMSQAGMAAHWRREGRGHADRLRLGINGVGALATGAALAIILAAKFIEGAWLTIVVIPATLVLLRVVHRYYANLDRQLLSGRQRRLDLREHAAPLVVIPIGRWDRISQKAVAYAVRLSPDVTALHCTDLEGPDAEEQEAKIRGEWDRYVEQPAREASLPAPHLLVEPSPYRSVLGPLLRTIEELKRRHPDRAVAVVL
ncbi:MAG: APC family permease, partial [Acetobacteraceae bacterium]|nr:APC family permease [Acetobacteraceae bacterium]